jgi:serine/threonine protein kinase
VAAGLSELHKLGFVHRDLKPENIVLNTGHPLRVALIDFDRSLPTTCTTNTGVRGTPGYQPSNYKFQDGDPQWDLYSLVAIIAECDMGTSEYMRVKNEKEGESVLKRHISEPSTCKVLAQLVKDVIFCPKGDELPLIADVVASIKKINFKKKIEVISRVGRHETLKK